MRRSQLREHVFKLLFMSEFNPPEDMESEISLYLSSPEEEIGEEEGAEIREKIIKIVPCFPAMDKVISENSEKWPLSRMGKVELSILRLAVYEIFLDDSVPEKVAVNEAVELAKKFGQDNAGSFVNGVLSGVLKDKERTERILSGEMRDPQEKTVDPGEEADG